MKNIGSAFLPVVLGLSLIILAAPRIRIEAYVVQANEIVASLERRDATPDDRTISFAENLEARARASDSPRLYALAARAWIALATRYPKTPDQGIASNERAMALQAASLAHAPSDQYGWQRLSHTLAMDHEWEEAATAWRLAVQTGPFEPEIMPIKLQSGLALWRYMDPDQRNIFASLALTFIETYPKDFATLVAKLNGGGIIRQALAADVEAAALDHLLSPHHP